MLKIYVNEEPQSIDIPTALAQVSEQRREKTLGYKREGDRRLCLAAYLLLRQGIREVYGIDYAPVFDYAPRGKPSIAGHPEIEFNISHCPMAAACVISDIPVGIDVESIRPFKSDLGHYVLNDDEYRQVVESADPDVEFIKLWTMKESLLKMTGEGISGDLPTILQSDSAGHVFTTKVNASYVLTVCSAPLLV